MTLYFKTIRHVEIFSHESEIAQVDWTTQYPICILLGSSTVEKRKYIIIKGEGEEAFIFTFIFFLILFFYSKIYIKYFLSF